MGSGFGFAAEVAELDDLLWSAFAHSVPGPVRGVDVGDGRALVDGIEREEVHFLDSRPRLI